jgi:DNA-binding NarL/FixJ family response regulator
MSEAGRSALLVDPHPLWLDAVEHLFERIGIRVVARTTSLADGLELLVKHRPALVIVELAASTGELDGVEFITRARDELEAVHVIVVSSSDDPDDVERAMDAGAVAYVLKTTCADDLAFVVRQAFDHSIYLGNARAVVGRPASRPADRVALTRREVEILGLAAEGRTNPELARMLWITEQTVKFHLTNIYRKLGVSNRTEASRWAQRHGFLTHDR